MQDLTTTPKLQEIEKQKEQSKMMWKGLLICGLIMATLIAYAIIRVYLEGGFNN